MKTKDMAEVELVKLSKQGHGVVKEELRVKDNLRCLSWEIWGLVTKLGEQENS